VRWRWLSKAAVLAIHAEQLAEHGGAPGLRDEGLLDSALARPENLAVYEDPDAAALAAAYAFGIVRNHPFVDGNKRTGFVAAATFLLLNGFDLNTSEQEVVRTFWRLADGSLSERELAAWFRSVTPPSR
jgi:death-on-curing protein